MNQSATWEGDIYSSLYIVLVLVVGSIFSKEAAEHYKIPKYNLKKLILLGHKIIKVISLFVYSIAVNTVQMRETKLKYITTKRKVIKYLIYNPTPINPPVGPWQVFTIEL